MKNLYLVLLLISFTMLFQQVVQASALHKEDTLAAKYFAGFSTEQKMNDALNEVLKQKNFDAKDSAQLNVGWRLANKATDSLKWVKKQITDFKTKQNNYNTQQVEMLKSQNGAMLQVSKKIIATSNQSIKKLIAQRAKNKAIRKANNKSVDGFLSGLHYYNTKFSANSKSEDTLKVLHQIDLMNDSAKIYTTEYLAQVEQFNSTYDSLMQRTTSYQKHTDKGVDSLKKIIEKRKSNLQDSDFAIESQKKNWQLMQSNANQFLFLKGNFLIDTLMNQFNRIQQNHFKVIAIQKKILKQNKKMRRYKQENLSLIQGYLDVSNSMQTFLYRHNDLVRLYSSKCNHLKKELKSAVKISKRENEQLTKELNLAKQNKSIRSKSIATITSAELKIINTHLANCLKHNKAVQRAKQKIK